VVTGRAAVAPVVGIAGTRRRLHLPFADVDACTAFAGYVDGVEREGGVAVVLPPSRPERAGPLLSAVSALVLTGGPDLDPASYGAAPGPADQPPDPARDRFEFALVAEAWRRGIPVLGICRGLHVLNVARGGTLRQHVEGHAGRRHELAVTPGSRLAGIAGTSAETGSLHHQAVDRLGNGLRAVATAPDGGIEAIEAIHGSPVLGVQWHPELEDGFLSRALFRWVVEAGRASTATGPGGRRRREGQWSA
jgi:gamma-glutamyl-gamma-aminobutyrate hydrolase PuuD